MNQEADKKLAAKVLEGHEGFKLSPMLRAALNGDSGTMIAARTAKQLTHDLEAEGRDTFTMADLREAQRKIFEGS